MSGVYGHIKISPTQRVLQSKALLVIAFRVADYILLLLHGNAALQITNGHWRTNQHPILFVNEPTPMQHLESE